MITPRKIAPNYRKIFWNVIIGNVLISNANFGVKTTDYQIQLIVADKSKIMRDDVVPPNERTNRQIVPFDGTDEVVDIHANTLAILNDLTKGMLCLT